MRPTNFSKRMVSAITVVLTILCSACFFSVNAVVYIVTDTLTVSNKTAIVRASSELRSNKNEPMLNSLKNIFDNDSTTRWIDGSNLTGEGEWIEVKFPQKSKFKGLILGPGCRKDFMSLEDYSIPLEIKLKLDEKPTLAYTIDWDDKSGSTIGISRQEVNLRKAFLWFNSDTAFTTATIHVKFEKVQKGARYEKLAISDYELIEANDTRFELLDILKKLTINPNDLGVVNSPALTIGNDDPVRMKQVVDSIAGSSSSSDSSKVDQALNSGMHAISDPAEVGRLIGVLKTLFLKDNRMVRYRSYGRTVTYMIMVGQVQSGSGTWDIWRYITTTKTSKGIEVSIRYVPFVN